jgi:hypothetical protein
MGCQDIDDVAEFAIDRGGITDHSDAGAVEPRGAHEALRAELNGHSGDYFTARAAARDARFTLACPWGALIHYALLVVSPACFARAESRSSLDF